jgi:hypothetical protein
MQARLARNYILLEVISEGAGLGKWVRESRLSIWPSPTYDTSRQIGSQSRIIAYGRASTVREGLLHDQLSTAPTPASRFFRVQYAAPSSMSITFVSDSTELNLVIFDAPGPILDVQMIEDGILSGRWIDGGIAMLSTPTPVGVLMEQGAGYFCAWPSPKL